MTSGVEPWTRAVCPVSMELGGGGDEGKLNDVDVVPAIEASIFSLLLLPFVCVCVWRSWIGRQRLLFSFFFRSQINRHLLPRSIPPHHLQEQEGPVSISGLMSGRRDAFHGSTC